MLGSVGCAFGQTDGGVIDWDASRPLTWADFRGAADPDASPRTAALTAASISVGYELEVRSNGRCFFEIANVQTEAVFHTERSWVRDGGRTDLVLEHEQGHFDLTQVFRMMLEREAARLVGDARRCPNRDAMAAAEADAAERVRAVRDPIFLELDRVQAQYDAETGHGTLADVQREWTARIGEALRRGSW